ncbi:MAG: Ig-like domain-containing protein [Deltaproteobacteria bacterium]|nr:Ig-like domain-containing protein [Deltaproteobacteria bacterium]
MSSTVPANGAMDVAINSKIAATFSEEVAPETISSTSFLVTDPDSVSVAGTVDMDATNHIATFTPSEDLASNTLLTVTINGEVEGMTGRVLEGDYAWTFTTGEAADLTAPTVSSTVPADGAVDVAINSKIAATFSEEMDPQTIADSTFLVTRPDSTSVTGVVVYALVGNVATFTPDSDLELNTTFTATITGAADLAGNVLAGAYVWSFTTGGTVDATAPTVTSTNPQDADLNVAINKKITATFSESMDALTITTANYTVTGPGVTNVTGTVAYALEGNIATFTPDSNLAPDTTFTATVTGAADLAGNVMESAAVWTFTTGAEEAQTVAQEPVPLGSSSNFAILASAAITNIATSAITGDVGLTPDSGSNISGFSVPETCPEVTGLMYAVDAAGPACALIDPELLTDAKTDAEVAFINARAAVRGTPQAISGNLNGLTLYPGLYESGSSLEISPGGFLYLDAQGDGNAIFIIRSATSITTEATSEVVLTKGAKATNVYWTAGSAVTLGTNSIMKGTMVAGTALSLLTGANLEGRALNQGAAAEAVTLDSCTITVPSP